MRACLEDVGVRHLSRSVFNCYLVEDGGQGAPFVVDAGLPSTGEAAFEELTGRLGRRPEELACIAATHAHSDHVGGAPALARRTRAPIFLPDKVRDYRDGERPKRPKLIGMCRALPAFVEQPFDLKAAAEFVRGFWGDGFALGPFRFGAPIAGYLAGGERLEHAPDWEVIATPGHTDCSLCFWNHRTRTLLSGDTVLTVQGRAWFSPEITDSEPMDRTEARLRQLPVEHVLPGHGQPISGTRLMEEAWSHRDRVWPRRQRRFR